jgi:RNA polymerase sigma factor (sigma-70 family)
MTKDERKKMAERYWPLACKIAARMRWRFLTFENVVDFRGEAAVGLCQAADQFSGDPDVSFVAFARKRIEGACIDAVRLSPPSGYRRTNSHRGRDSPYEGAPTLVPLSHLSGISSIETGDLPVGWEVDAADEVDGLLRTLPPRHREVVRMMHLEAGMTYLKAAKRIGRAEYAAWTAYKDAMVMLKHQHRA